MCGTCLVSLVAAAPTADSMSAPGPVTVGPTSLDSPIPVSVMPMTITMPDIITTSAPAAPPAPIVPRASDAPTASPAVPQAPPDPERPAPGPQPFPEPTPVPDPIVPSYPIIVPTPPRPEPEPTKPTTIPIPVAKPAAREAAKARERRHLTADEISTAKITSSVFGFIAIICGIATLITFFAMFGNPNAGFGLFLLMGFLAVLTIVCTRQAIFRSAIAYVRLKPQGALGLGAHVPLEIRVGVVNTVPIDEAKLTIIAEEEASTGSGKSRTTSRHIAYRREIPIVPPQRWNGGEEVVLNPELQIPHDAPVSFFGKDCALRWRAELWVSIPGWYPDIREKIPLTVDPVRVDGTSPALGMHEYSLPLLGRLRGTMALQSAVDVENAPIVEAGARVPFTLTFNPEEAQELRRCEVEIVYYIEWTDNSDYRSVAKCLCYKDVTLRGVSAVEGELVIPPNVPPSYRGALLQVRWFINIQATGRKSQDWRQTFPINVVPRRIDAAPPQG